MRVLITGGASSGKSAYGEAVAVSLGQPRWYIAAMRPEGAEGQARISRHQQLRQGRGFVTLERYVDLAGLDICGGVALVECLSNLIANEMFDPEGSGDRCVEAVLAGLDHVAEQCGHVVVITSEVGRDGVVYPAGSRDYIRALEEANRRAAQGSDLVVEVVCGLPLAVKGELPCL